MELFSLFVNLGLTALFSMGYLFSVGVAKGMFDRTEALKDAGWGPAFLWPVTLFALGSVQTVRTGVQLGQSIVVQDLDPAHALTGGKEPIGDQEIL